MSLSMIRRYGWKASLKRICKRLIRPVYRGETFLIFFLDHSDQVSCDPTNIQPVTSELLSTHELLCCDKNSALELLHSGSRGFACCENRRMLGIAWIQESGDYHFGSSGIMHIPENCVVFKNLFVASEARGQGIGLRLNQARIAAGSGKICFAFMLPENRYAIRNWECFGMRCLGSVSEKKFFGGHWQHSFRPLSDSMYCAMFRQASIGHE